MPRVIHIQTTVQTILGVLDDDGNVTEQITLTGNPTAPTDEAFSTVAEQIREKREELEASASAAANGSCLA